MNYSVGFMMNYEDLQKLFTPEMKELLKNDGADFDNLDYDMMELLVECGFDDIGYCNIAELCNLKDGGMIKYENENVILLYAEKTGLYEKYENKEEIYNEICNKLNKIEYEDTKMFNVKIEEIKDYIGKISICNWDSES